MAQDREHDRMDCKRPSSPLLCANNCGFFGCPATMNLCSKCYKNLVVRKEESSLSVKVLGEKLPAISAKEVVSEAISMVALKTGAEEGGTVSAPLTIHTVDKGILPITAVPLISIEVKPTDELSGPETVVATTSERPNTGPTRCLTCRKRVGLLGFKCRCGGLFCPSHRYSDLHDCTFDYKAAGRDAIAKTNPVVIAEKVRKI